MNLKDRLVVANDLAVLEKEAEKRRRYKVNRYFSDEGFQDGGTFYPPRDLYTKSLQFFEGGRLYPERLLLGGNRCLSPWTVIETGAGERQIGEMIGSAEFSVPTSVGESRYAGRASDVFLKSIEPAFRVYLDSGAWFDATWEHRVWDGGTWRGLGQLIQISGGQRWWQTPADSTASYDSDSYRDGGQLPWGLNTARASLRPLIDALAQPSIVALLGGGGAPRFGYNRQRQGGGRLPTLDEPTQIEALCGNFSDPTVSLDGGWSAFRRQAFAQSARVCGLNPGVLKAYHHPQSHEVPSCVTDHDCGNGQPPHHTVIEDATRCSLRMSSDVSWLQFRVSACGLVAFFPHSLWLDRERVQAIVPIGYSPILDFTVEDVHSYMAAGVRHHNTGKTESAGFEAACHLTGIYPPWWKGHRFTHPINMWCAGDTATTTRDIIQLSLYGPIESAPGTGFIPAHLIASTAKKNAVPNGLESITVKHVSGGHSIVQFKSYDQKREAYQGTEKHLIWLDEECPDDIYTECLLRTLTCGGKVIVTFTPVEGLTPFVQKWLDQGVLVTSDGQFEAADIAVFHPGNEEEKEEWAPDVPESQIKVEDRHKLIVMVSWDEVPHLSPTAREQMLADIPLYQRAARTRGIPSLGSGVIYPVPENEISEKPFAIPDHWPRGYGMDVGWNWTVAVWAAYDLETGTWYLYHEHARSHAEPPVHAAGIKAPGEWIPGRIDPAANGRQQADGEQLLQTYLNLGLRIDIAPNAVESGIHQIWTLLTSGKLRVFSNLKHWFAEYRMYRRDDKGKVVKKNDHLMDATRYMINSGYDVLRKNPSVDSKKVRQYAGSQSATGWMG